MPETDPPGHPLIYINTKLSSRPLLAFSAAQQLKSRRTFPRKGHPMHPAIFAIAMGSQLAMPVSDSVPKLDVATTCKGSVEADKETRLDLSQSYDKCMSDENTARQQLGPIWSSYSADVRTQCEGEASAAGNSSYVDLLICLQMTGGSGATSTTALKGASRKKREAN
jgi:hypothetical protein